MPLIAPQHAWKDKDHCPSQDWPEDCMVQWGGRGVVIGKDGSARGTAFFEAFPADGGFIRGEGATIAEAEGSALEKYARKMACDHIWGRGTYTNGGCICRKCGAFESRMKEIPVLGAWKAPLSSHEISAAMEGWMLAPGERVGHPDRAKDDRYRRRRLLRIRTNGIDIPDPPADPIPFDQLDDHPFVQECRDVTCRYLLDKGSLPDHPENRSGMEAFFRAMDMSGIRRELISWCEEHGEDLPDFLRPATAQEDPDSSPFP